MAAAGNTGLSKEQEKLLREGLGILDLVARRAERRMGGHIPLDDLLAIGRFALIDIVKVFEPDRARFAPYCSMRLKWAIIDGIRKETHGRTPAARARALLASRKYGETQREEPLHDGPDPTMEGYQSRLDRLLAGHTAALVTGLVTSSELEEAPDPQDSVEERIARNQLRRDLTRAVEALPTRERTLIERHYFGGEQFDAIATELGISKSWGSRLHAQALEVLSESLTREWKPEGA